MLASLTAVNSLLTKAISCCKAQRQQGIKRTWPATASNGPYDLVGWQRALRRKRYRCIRQGTTTMPLLLRKHSAQPIPHQLNLPIGIIVPTLSPDERSAAVLLLATLLLEAGGVAESASDDDRH